MSAPASISNAAPAREDSARAWSIVVLLSLGMVIAYIARVNISVAVVMPEFRKLFHLTDSDRGLLGSAFFWSYAILQIPAGWLVDRYGVKLPYALGFLAWSVVTSVTALAGSLEQLVALRVLLGVFEAMAQPASIRWIRFNFPEKRRGLAVGLFMTGSKIGPAVGAPLAAYLLKQYDWRAMFFILGTASLLWLVPWLWLVRNDDRQREQAAASTGAASMSFLQMMRNPIMWGTIIGTFCYMYFVYFCMTWMPAYFVEKRHLALSSMGLYTFFSFGGIALMSPLAGLAADRLIAGGRDAVAVRRAFVVAGFVIASTEVFGALTDSVPVALFFAVFSLTGLGLATANYWAITQTLMPGGAIGRMVGIQNCAANLPGIVAPILTGWLIQRTGDYRAPMQAIWCFLILGIAAYCFLVRAKYSAAYRGTVKI